MYSCNVRRAVDCFVYRSRVYLRSVRTVVIGGLVFLDAVNCASFKTRYFAGRNLLSIDTGYRSMVSPSRDGGRDRRDYFRGVSGAEYL